MYVHENDRREYVRAHDDDRVSAHACECVHVCVLRAYVNEHVHDDDARARGGGGGHVRDGDDQSHMRCHGLFHRVHMHIEVCSPNTAFRDTVYMKMIAVEGNGLKRFFKMLAVGS